MNEIERRNFVEDLQATRSKHVRKKLLVGGYVGWRRAVAKEWLEQHDAQKRFWISVGIGVFGLVVTSAVTLVAK